MKTPCIILAAGLLASCAVGPQRRAEPSAPVTREQAVRVADEASRKAMRIPKEVEPKVEETPDAFIMTFPMTLSKQQPPLRGPDYYTKVTVDKKTGKITELLVAP